MNSFEIEYKEKLNEYLPNFFRALEVFRSCFVQFNPIMSCLNCKITINMIRGEDASSISYLARQLKRLRTLILGVG